MKLALSVLTLILMTSGCGKAGGGSSNGPVVLPERAFNPPVAYQLQDKDCQGRTTPVDLTSATIPAWQAEVVNMVKAETPGTFTGLSLHNSIVKDTFFGVEYERKCDADQARGRECFSPAGQEKDYDVKEGTGWYLRVCNDGFAYDRKSIETVALTSAHYLDLAHRKYMQLKEPAAETPPQLLLNVLPVFADVYDNYVENGQSKVKKEYLVHNLAYYSSKKMIIVFPESVERDQSLPGYLWESQFVLGHEYGHHVEQLRTGLLTSHLGIDWNPITHSWEDLNVSGSGGTSTEFTQILGSVSEGFADLLSFYAEGGTAYSLSGIPNLGPNRDIRISTFANGDDKVLTLDRFNLLTERTQPRDRGSDGMYSDIHTGGAILAFAADQVFKQVSLARGGIEEGSQADMDYRYRMLLRWIDRTGEGLSLVKDEQAESHLNKISEAFASVVTDPVGDFQLRGDLTDKELQQGICQTLADTLPVLTRPAFSLEGGDCSGN